MSTPADAAAPGTVKRFAPFLLDAVLVVGFAALGRASHDSDPFGPGLATTAWPFLAALVLGWAVTLAWRAPAAPARTGIPVWILTVGGGMLLRAASGQGIAPAFVVVASLTLLVLLVGWRLVAHVVARARSPRASDSSSPGADRI